MREAMNISGTQRPVRVDPNQDKRWNQLVRTHPGTSSAYLTGWGRMLTQAFPSLAPIYIGIQEDNGLSAGLSLVHVRSWLTGNRLISLPFATTADPLVDNALQLKMLLEAAKSKAKNLGAHHIEIRCAATAPIARQCGLTPVRQFKTHILHLGQDPEQLLKKFDRSCVRQQIKKSLKTGLQFTPASGEKGLSEFYSLYVKTRKRLRLPPLPSELFTGLFRELGPTGNAEILLANKDDMVVGGLFTLRHRQRVSFEHVGVDHEFRGLPIFHFLYWNAIVRALAHGYQEIDFGRTSVNNPGLMKFKKRWNTQESDILHFEIPIISPKGQQPGIESDTTERLSYRALQKACELAPPHAFIQLGRFCYRHYM